MIVYDLFRVHRHGLNEGDWKREDRQNWAGAQRLASRQVQNCLKG